MKSTVKEIVEDLLEIMSEDDKDYLRTVEGFEKSILISALGRMIRNNYSLWQNNPLTKRWREEGANDMRDGVDYSEDHPDNVSSLILDEILVKIGVV
jgi:hypothetical protein